MVNRALTALGATAVVAAIVAPAAHAAPTRTVAFGNTTVQLAPQFVGALGSLGVTPRAIGPAALYANRGNVFAAFPITTGEIDLANARGEIKHVGGLRLTAGSTVVELKNFLIDTSGAQPVLTGVVIVNENFVGRIPLFDLTLPAGVSLPLNGRPGSILRLPGVSVTLNASAAGALNGVFGVTAFEGGFPIGTATVTTLIEH